MEHLNNFKKKQNFKKKSICNKIYIEYRLKKTTSNRYYIRYSIVFFQIHSVIIISGMHDGLLDDQLNDWVELLADANQIVLPDRLNPKPGQQ